ncbi:monooxygenase [Penicillium citrinum]|uniref:Monooxygenase n=1 Tax=Penicillium citrinum TaxID=5077 RepID=A0A9W9P1V1_PENCI|nr:monooxygenase [Penicillium citrinum]KAJ5233819.1 monooxygenase [Penicillium citrinum]
MALKPCKVIIAGAGLAGLTLALTLERIGVDYVLLEAYSDIVTRAGAGICLLPNALRILDQLGCYEDLVSRVKQGVENINIRKSDGESMKPSSGWWKFHIQRYGYGFHWCDRTTVLEVLYENVKDKSKVIPNKRVETVQYAADSVSVTTIDGSIYSGDILIGTDGIHSRVRKEMNRYAENFGLGEIYTEQESKVPATYACMFGLSTSVPGIPEACLDFGVEKGFSYVLGSGPENRTYWFLFVNLGRALTGSEIPRLTESDIDRVVQEHWDDRITPDIRLADLYKHKRNVVFSPMREFVYKKWHLNRSIVLGDAAHQMTSNIAQGGAQAIESAAELANNLISALSNSTNNDPLSIEEVENMFERFQAVRHPRVQAMMELSHKRQLMDAMETPEMEDLVLNKLPKMLPDLLVQRWDETFLPAASLRMLPIPKRPKISPFHDEISQDLNLASKF